MHTSSIRKSAILLPVLMLASCTAGQSINQSLETSLENPLVAERYYDDLVEQMVDLVLQNDPLSTDETTKDIIEETRVEGLKNANEATDEQERGKRGVVVSDFGYSIGEVLILDGKLYIGPDFETKPGPDLHAYLSTVLDPRDGSFPDEAAIDLGILANPYGAQIYNLSPEVSENAELRTFVLYDTKLRRIYGFAQLSGL
jgi:hypothetical protein